MLDHLPRGAALALAALVVLGGCQDRERCEPGDEIGCECDDGTEGTRYCLPNRSYDQCYCWSSEPWPDPSIDVPPAPRFDAGTRDAAGPEDAGVGASPGDGVRLASGSGTLIDVFAAGSDVWLVEPAGITRITLEDGSEQARWSAPRPLIAALFDGERLLALDGAKLTLLEKEALEPGESVNLVEPCTFAALLDDGTLICTTGSSAGPFYGFDTTGTLQQSFTVSSIRRGRVTAVPGTPRFFISNGSSSSFVQVFERDADGGAPRPLDGGISFSSSVGLAPPLAFDGLPAENLVNAQGILLRMNGSCGGGAEPCLARTGTLGLLGPQESFLGLDTADGELFGLIQGDSQLSFSSARCSTQPCRLARIDVAARELRAELAFRRPLRGVIALRALPEAVVLGLGASSSSFDPFATPDGGFEVVRVDWQAAE